MSAASQEAVARRAGITQGALRYHFPTKKDLLTAFFRAQYQHHRDAIERVLLEPATDPRQRILEMASAHLTHIRQASDTVTFERFAYLAREDEDRTMQDEWYGFLTGHYAGLLRQINPDASARACEFQAFHIVTLCLGAWMTLGRSHPDLLHERAEAVQDRLLEAIDGLLDLPVKG